MLAWWFARGHAADLILLVLAGEWLWLGRRWGRAAATWRLLPGAMMIVALRLALTGADWRWIALALAASFPPHLIDLSHGRRKPH
jgi:hypothetical protein